VGSKYYGALKEIRLHIKYIKTLNTNRSPVLYSDLPVNVT